MDVEKNKPKSVYGCQQPGDKSPRIVDATVEFGTESQTGEFFNWCFFSIHAEILFHATFAYYSDRVAVAYP